MVKFTQFLHYLRFLFNVLITLPLIVRFREFKRECKRHYIFYQKELILEDARTVRRQAIRGLKKIP